MPNRNGRVLAWLLTLAVIGFAATSGQAAPPADFGLHDGDLISAIFSADPDVYIINQAGYKRLFLNPEIFKFYGHLGGFANVKLVTPEVRDAFPTSGLFRNCEKSDPRVYGLELAGEDKGRLRWIDTSGDQAVKDDPDFFKKVFCINDKEFRWYPKGEELKSVKAVPQYQRAIPAQPTTPVLPASPSKPFVPTASVSQPLVPTLAPRLASGSFTPTPAVSVTPASVSTAPAPAPASSAPRTAATPSVTASASFTAAPTPSPTPSSSAAAATASPTPTPSPTLTPVPTPTATVQITCTDSDGGINFYTRGKGTGSYPGSLNAGWIYGETDDSFAKRYDATILPYYIYYDFCDSSTSNHLNEAFCNSSHVLSTYGTFCAYGCSKGVCNSAPTPAPTPTPAVAPVPTAKTSSLSQQFQPIPLAGPPSRWQLFANYLLGLPRKLWLW